MILSLWFVGANRCVRPVIALLGVLLGRHIGLPLLRVFFCRFCRGEPVCSPGCCIAVVLLGRHIGLPLLRVFFCCFCRGEPVCSPCYCIAWCFVGQTHRSAPTELALSKLFTILLNKNLVAVLDVKTLCRCSYFSSLQIVFHFDNANLSHPARHHFQRCCVRLTAVGVIEAIYDFT